ncbi:MAG: FixH family protein [Betaproteobacteria bacterium]|nr:FixH family protein [Betaproteobacteria bacterium]
MSAKPWYREPWPWIVMSGPALVLVAGAATMWIAFASADGLVAEDYYKQGLAINKVLAREQAAKARGIAADVRIAPGRISVTVANDAPEAIFISFSHATRSGQDFRLRLARTASGEYSGELPSLSAGRWRLVVEDPRAAWRISKELS